jgi:hypothetical protein
MRGTDSDYFFECLRIGGNEPLAYNKTSDNNAAMTPTMISALFTTLPHLCWMKSRNERGLCLDSVRKNRGNDG